MRIGITTPLCKFSSKPRYPRLTPQLEQKQRNKSGYYRGRWIWTKAKHIPVYPLQPWEAVFCVPRFRLFCQTKLSQNCMLFTLVSVLHLDQAPFLYLQTSARERKSRSAKNFAIYFRQSPHAYCLALGGGGGGGVDGGWRLLCFRRDTVEEILCRRDTVEEIVSGEISVEEIVSGEIQSRKLLRARYSWGNFIHARHSLGNCFRGDTVEEIVLGEISVEESFTRDTVKEIVTGYRRDTVEEIVSVEIQSRKLLQARYSWGNFMQVRHSRGICFRWDTVEEMLCRRDTVEEIVSGKIQSRKLFQARYSWGNCFRRNTVEDFFFRRNTVEEILYRRDKVEEIFFIQAKYSRGNFIQANA